MPGGSIIRLDAQCPLQGSRGLLQLPAVQFMCRRLQQRCHCWIIAMGPSCGVVPGRAINRYGGTQRRGGRSEEQSDYETWGSLHARLSKWGTWTDTRLG